MEKGVRVKRKTPYWWKVIEAAKARKQRGLQAFTPLQRARAAEWTTCACGEQDAKIPRYTNGVPVDDPLGILACDFSQAVGIGDVKAATSLLRAIEKRAAEVLREIAK